jgi:hypothetical protein
MNHLCMEIVKYNPEAVFLRLPQELRRPVLGGCVCPFCNENPSLVPMWDTLVVPTKKPRAGQRPRYSHTIHMPVAVPE